MLILPLSFSFLCENLLVLLSRSEFLLTGDHGLDTIVHILNKVLLRATESTAVRDIEDAIAGIGVLTAGSTDLDVVLSSDCLELLHAGTELGKVDVDGGTEGGTKVGWAGSDVTQVVVVGETGVSLNDAGGSGESLEDGADVSSRLHGDNTELILFVDPDEEGLVVVVEDTSASWPVTVEAASLKETISLPT